MTGVPSYSTTASENVQSNTGINWDEGMPPAAVNNSARQNMADMRLQWNDASWFQYGNGSKTVAHTRASATSTTIATDVTTYYHVGRRIKAVGSATGTIYGSVASVSYSAPNTTITYTWDSGSLSNEAITIYASATQVTGKPIHGRAVSNYTADRIDEVTATHGVAIKGTSTNSSATAGDAGEYLASITLSGGALSLSTGSALSVVAASLPAGDYIVSGIVSYTGNAATTLTNTITSMVLVTNTTGTSGTSNRFETCHGGSTPFSAGVVDQNVGPVRISLSTTTNIFLTARAVFGVNSCSAYGQINIWRAR